ncbi:hypothetical protein M422DRAFT_242249 [Sphaerobolus stellatus SS14]|nr:hypothetical protein M422DRAFT_242249 [Sphaerobolus stellatus SS14]
MGRLRPYQGGHFVLRTLPVDYYSRSDIVLIYAGISSYVAPTRDPQDKNGGVLSHIKDLTASQPKGAIGGLAYTTDKQVFHTDQGSDIVSLFALGTAKERGTSRISSSWRVYNELAEKRPDLVKTLAEPWAVDKFGADLHTHHGPSYIVLTRRLLFNMHDAEQFSLGLSFKKGDIQYINNLSIFHVWDGFKDKGKQTHHLICLWLPNEELTWQLPEDLKPLWQKTFTIEPESQTSALQPVVREAVKGRL